MKRMLISGLLFGALKFGAYATDIPELKTFFAKYCTRCHGERKQKGDVRLDQLTLDFKNKSEHELLSMVVEQLESNEMPPEGKKKRPTPEESIDVISWLNKKLKGDKAAEDKHNTTALRRLNRQEYANSIRDLLDIDTSLFDPASGILDDPRSEGFDNQSESLVMSSFLLEEYLKRAKASLKRATFFGEQPKVTVYGKKKGKHIMSKSMYVNTFRYLAQRLVKDADILITRNHFISHLYMKNGVHASGRYKIRIVASGIDPEKYTMTRGAKAGDPKPFIMRVLASNAKTGFMKRSPLEHEIVEEEIIKDVYVPKNKKPQSYEFEVWLEKGYVPRIQFLNGPTFGPSSAHDVARSIHKDKQIKKGEKYIDFQMRVFKAVVDDPPGPMLKIHDMVIEGPFHESWPPRSHVNLYGKKKLDEKEAKRLLKRFCAKAFRTHAKDTRINFYVKHLRTLIDRGESLDEALNLSYQAVLCSPDFLYLSEGKGGQLDAFALASRLSYYLWSTMPDKELFEKARNGSLVKEKVLLTQIDRMLTDPKAETFTDRFSESWLHLYNIGTMPPDDRDFKNYRLDYLEDAMKEETRLLFAHVLKKNRNVMDFVEGDYSFVNPGLAKHYGMKEPATHDFKKVSFKKGMRGGLLGNASVLTATANGVDTSPIIRGVWMLENIIGKPTANPPPDVDALPTDFRKAKTLKEKIAMHRSEKSCNECHKRIDPMGFAFENFDAIGGWRTKYRVGMARGKKVDATYEMENGSSYKDISELKKYIVKHHGRDFVHCLVEKMLVYATGREMSVYDKNDIDEIVHKLEKKGKGLKDLVRLVAQSKTFRTK